MSAKRKRSNRPKLWSFTAGEAPFSVEVHERTPGGVLYVRLFDPARTRKVKVRGKVKVYRGAQRRRSLGHRNREEAIAHAEAEARTLRAGAEALGGRVTVAGVVALYLLHRTPQKGATETRKDDERHAAFWTRLYGTCLVSDLGDIEWNEAKRRRASGEYDARGVWVPEAERRPVGPRGVDSTLVFIIAVFNWALGFKTKGRRLIDANPFAAPAPGVKRTLERPKNLAPVRPVATYDRFQKIRAKAPHVRMFARKGDRDAGLIEVGRADYTHGEGPVMLWLRPSYLPELMDLAEATGRRIGAICRLWYSDFVVGSYRDETTGEQRRGVTHIRWRPFKGATEKVVPVNADARTAIERILSSRPGLGDHWVFPSPRKAAQPITRQLARAWLRKAEDLAGVEHLERGAWHPYRRKWATERKHLPDADVMEAGGWADERSLKTSYQHADEATTLAVVNEPRKLVERQGKLG